MFSNALSFSAVMTNITIFCLVHHDLAEHAFPVHIPKTSFIGDLKKLIKEERPDVFGNVVAVNLSLWKVNIPIDENVDAVLDSLVLNGKNAKLQPYWEVGKPFHKPPEGHIHIVVERPPGKCYFFAPISISISISAPLALIMYFKVNQQKQRLTSELDPNQSMVFCNFSSFSY